MDLWSALRILRRRWLVLLVGLLLTGVALSGIVVKLAPQYTASGTVIVIQPSVSSNPLNSLDSANALAASVAATLTNTGTSEAQVKRAGGAASYTLTVDANLPIVTITTTSTDPGNAVYTVSVVARVMQDGLFQRQRDLGVTTSTLLKVLPLDIPTSALATTGKVKVLAIAAGLGVLVAISAAFIAEAIIAFRRREKTVPSADLTPGPRSDESVVTVKLPRRRAGSK